MIIDRHKQIQFFKDEYRAESEVFKIKFQTQAISLLQETEEMYVGKFLKFQDETMIMKFPNTRNLPRKGEHLFCMLLPNNLQIYKNWGVSTYQDLYNERHKGTDVVCIWHQSTDDPNYSLVGFRQIDVDFASIIKQHPNNILVFAPQQPPLDYISNLKKITEDTLSNSVSSILDTDFNSTEWEPTLIKQHGVTSFVKDQMSLSDTMIIQGPPGTGKTYMISELCYKFCSEGKSVLVTALTNRALMEIVSKHFLSKMLCDGKVFKTNLTTDEEKEIRSLQSLKQVTPLPGCLVLSTYYITSGYATELTMEQPFDIVIMDEASQALLSMFAVSKKIGKLNIWVGDVKQLPPIVSLNEDRISNNRYSPLINGLDLLTSSSYYPIYQLTSTYRFGERAAHYTGKFYNNSIVSQNHNNQYITPYSLKKAINSKGGPSLILTDMNPDDDCPSYAINMATYIANEFIKSNSNKEISILSCKIKTVKALQRSITQSGCPSKNIIIETIARIQGLTTDITILLIPNSIYFFSLEPQLFNVATSRAKEHTIIIADKNILNYRSMNKDVKSYLTELYHDQMIYIPISTNYITLQE